MAFFRKALIASSMIAAGVASTTGAALADDHEPRGDETNFINAQGTDALNQTSACDIYVPILDILPIDEADLNAEAPILNEQGDGNAKTDVPNADNTCTPDSTKGSVDSSDAGTVDAERGTTTRGEDD